MTNIPDRITQGFVICHWSFVICHFQEIADFAVTLSPANPRDLSLVIYHLSFSSDLFAPRPLGTFAPEVSERSEPQNHV